MREEEEEEEAPPTLISIPSPTTTPLITRKSDTSSYSPPSSSSSSSSKTAKQFVVKNRYKFWALAAILLLAFWSMFTGSVTLKWSASNLTTRLNDDDLNLPTYDDLDILEVEDREKVVRHLWDLYTQRQNMRRRRSSAYRLPRFWQEAFEAAYDPLNSDVPAVRNAAVSEIAKMSIHSSVLNNNNVAAADDPFLPHHPKGNGGELKNNKMKNTKEIKKVTTWYLLV